MKIKNIFKKLIPLIAITIILSAVVLITLFSDKKTEVENENTSINFDTETAVSSSDFENNTSLKCPTTTYYTDESETMKIYRDEELGFETAYLSEFTPHKYEDGSGVYFADESDWAISNIIAEPTNFKNTKEWLDAQPKGSSTSPGYRLLFWLSPRGMEPYKDGRIIVEKYLVIDSDEGKPIYGKYITGVIVENGMFYEINHREQYRADQTPYIGTGLINETAEIIILSE